jgi:hypothetical protein
MGKIADKIKKERQTLEERGLNKESYFSVQFSDDSQRTEHDTSWHSISDPVKVEHPGGDKIVLVCSYPVKELSVSHNGKKIGVVLKKDEQAYQAIRASTTFFPGGSKKTEILGRIVGKIKSGKVIEEYFINDITGEVSGFRNK